MTSPSPQKSLDETMGLLRMATNHPAWMPTAPKVAVANRTCASPMKLSSNPKRVRLSWAPEVLHSPTSPSGATPKNDADSGHDLLSEDVEQLFEEVEQQPEANLTSVLEELSFGTVARASGWTAPGTPPCPHPASQPPAESLPAVAVPKVSAAEPSSPLPLVAAARAQDPGQEVPENEAAVPEAEAAAVPDAKTAAAAAATATAAAAGAARAQDPGQEVPENEAAVPEAEAAAVPDAKTAAAAAAAATAAAAAAGASGPKVNKMKIPQRPEKFFKKVMRPKLAEGGIVDFTEFLVDWAPERLKAIKAAMRDPTYEALKVEAKSVVTSYDAWCLQGMAEQRPTEGVRIMMKVKGPSGKLQQAGSKVFPFLKDQCCSKHAYLYLDMLRLVAMVCKHKKAGFDLMKTWHSQVYTYVDFFFQEE